jgi:pentatricopeptide repeat protein
MRSYGYCPRVATWSAVVSIFGRQPETAEKALQIWEEVRGWRFGNQEVYTDTGAYNAALNACISLRDIARAEALWQQLQQEGLQPDVLTFNIMIRGYALIGEEQQMEAGVENMEHRGVRPDVSTYNTRVAGHVQLGDVATAERVLDEVRELAGMPRRRSLLQAGEAGAGTDSKSSDRVFVESRNELREAEEQLVLARSRVVGGLSETRGDESGLGNGLLESGRLGNGSLENGQLKNGQLAKEKLDEGEVGEDRLGNGQVQKVRSDDELVRNPPVGYAPVRNSAGTNPSDRDGETSTSEVSRISRPWPSLSDLRDEAVAGSRQTQRPPPGKSDGSGRVHIIRPTVRTYTALLRGYVKEGRLKESFDLVEEMVSTSGGRVEALPNVITYTTLIDGCVRKGKLGVARKVVEWMQRQGVAPNTVTYNTLLRGAAQARDLGAGMELWKEMEEKGVDADVVTYNTMMDLCIKCDQVSEAFRWFKR